MWLAAVTVALAVALTGCTQVTGITVTPREDTIAVGQSVTLSARVAPAKASQVVTWESNAATVASVSRAGVVTGLGVGTARVTATSRADDRFTAFATITVVAAQAPLATDDDYLATAGATLTVDAPGVLANDSHPQGDTLTALLEEDVTNGLLELDADGGFRYTPNDGFTGEDSFTYRASDGILHSEIANVTITVVPAVPGPVPETCPNPDRPTGGPITRVDLAGGVGRTFEMTLPVEPLSETYHRFVFDDDEARSVYFRNGLTYHLLESRLEDTLYGHLYWPELGASVVHAVEFLSEAARKDRHVWIIEKIAGEWRTPRDVSNEMRVTYCRDTADERLEELVVILSNCSADGTRVELEPGGLPPLIRATNVGCHRWTGSLDMQETVSAVDHCGQNAYSFTDCFIPDSGPTPPATHEVSYTLRVDDLVLVRDDAAGASVPMIDPVPLPAGRYPLEFYREFRHQGGEAVSVGLDYVVEGACWRQDLAGSATYNLVSSAGIAVYDMLSGPWERAYVVPEWLGTFGQTLPVSTVLQESDCSPMLWDYFPPQRPLELPISTMWVQFAMSSDLRFVGCGGVMDVDTSTPFALTHDGRNLNLDVSLATSFPNDTGGGASPYHCSTWVIGGFSDGSGTLSGHNTLNLQAERE